MTTNFSKQGNLIEENVLVFVIVTRKVNISVTRRVMSCVFSKLSMQQTYTMLSILLGDVLFDIENLLNLSRGLVNFGKTFQKQSAARKESYSRSRFGYRVKHLSQSQTVVIYLAVRQRNGTVQLSTPR